MQLTMHDGIDNHAIQPSKLAKTITNMMPIQKVPHFFLSWNINYPNQGFHGLSTVSPGRFRIVPSLFHSHILPHPYQFIIHQQSFGTIYSDLLTA
jgi:hypothetical protein